MASPAQSDLHGDMSAANASSPVRIATSSMPGESQQQQLYAAPPQPAARLEYEAYAALAKRTLGSLSDRARQAVLDRLGGGSASQAAALAMASPDPVLEAVNAELWQRRDEYSTKRDISIMTGTFNVNAMSPQESLLPWVLPESLPNEPDIIALAFQEVVPLTPQQILLTDPSRLWVWENAIMEAINRRSTKQADYAFVRSEQLVGTALLILVKTNLLHNVRQIESATKKTGLRGMSGNKGGVAVRMKIFDTTLCFVTAHLAAGQSNVDQRNDDYRTISSGLSFGQGVPIGSHDHIFWFGDFNYRIEIPNERARWLAENDDYSALIAKDQLRRAQDTNMAFVGFTEGQIGFRPTYKYDNGTSTYDTSEKQRIPAWTDRILYRGSGLRQLIYQRAELITSDHRPVYAFFEAELRIHDQKKRKDVLSEIMSRRRNVSNRTGLGSLGAAGKELSSGESDEEDLPQPSNESQNWWDPSGPDSDIDSFSSSSDDDEEASGSRPNPFVRVQRTNVRRGQATSSSSLQQQYARDGSSSASTAPGGQPYKRRAPPPPLPGRTGRSTTPPAQDSGPSPSTTSPGSLGQAVMQQTFISSSQPLQHPGLVAATSSINGPARRMPPPIPSKPSLSSLGHPASGPTSAGAPPEPPRRPNFKRSKSAASTRSLLTDSD
ncbi:Inositol-1,4,5-trisphosphate 5-phosphatase 1 [Tilletia horrida]|nr:Inositol-1,4,5-trisphosphate 5-phosphatase 1 [Tilletia horrida]